MVDRNPLFAWGSVICGRESSIYLQSGKVVSRNRRFAYRAARFQAGFTALPGERRD